MTTFISLFSGFGLYDVGAIAADWEHVGGVEYDPAIAAVYQANIGPCSVGKVEDVDPAQFVGVDAVHASPVCKSFSNANVKGEEHADDITSAHAVARYIEAIKPKYFTLENVSAYQRSQSFGIVLAALSAGDYDVKFDVLNAADYGVPQTRKRLILRAIRYGRIGEIMPTHYNPKLGQSKMAYRACWPMRYASR